MRKRLAASVCRHAGKATVRGGGGKMGKMGKIFSRDARLRTARVRLCYTQTLLAPALPRGVRSFKLQMCANFKSALAPVMSSSKLLTRTFAIRVNTSICDGERIDDSLDERDSWLCILHLFSYVTRTKNCRGN